MRVRARACARACVYGSKTAWISVDVQFASPAQNDSSREFCLQHPSLKVGGRTFASKHQKSNYAALPRARVSHPAVPTADLLMLTAALQKRDGSPVLFVFGCYFQGRKKFPVTSVFRLYVSDLRWPA